MFIKKVILLLVTFSLGLFIYSCGEVDNSNTSVPFIKLEENVVSWKKIDNYTSFEIYANDQKISTTTELTYTLDLPEGNYVIKVRGFDGTSYSKFSNVLSFSVQGAITKLATPFISITNNTISWNSVNHANSYKIYIDDNYVTSVNQTAYEIDSEIKKCRIYIVAVATQGDYEDSHKSNVLKYEDVTVKPTNKLVNIFQINDTHGAFINGTDIYGFSKLSTIIKEIENNSELIKIANGDIFQGGYESNQTRGLCLIDALNFLNFDCFVIGNHEFDWGLEEIAKYKDGNIENGEANFPFLGANIVYKDSNEMPSWLDSYTIVESNSAKVGIIGVIGQQLTSSILTEKVENYAFLNPVPIVENLAAKLRNEMDCDFVIVSTHEYESSVNEEYAALTNDSRIDAVICGHTHQYIEETIERQDGYQMPIIQSNTKNISAGFLSLQIDEKGNNSSSMRHYIPCYYEDDQSFNSIIAKYQTIIDEGESIIAPGINMMNNDAIGTFACDAMIEQFSGDVAILNQGGVRTYLPDGDVKVKKILEIFPFDNKVLKVSIKGADLKNFYEYAGSSMYFNASFNINNIEDNKVYKLIIIDYVFTSTRYSKIFGKLNCDDTGCLIRDVVIEKFRRDFK